MDGSEGRISTIERESYSAEGMGKFREGTTNLEIDVSRGWCSFEQKRAQGHRAFGVETTEEDLLFGVKNEKKKKKIKIQLRRQKKRWLIFFFFKRKQKKINFYLFSVKKKKKSVIFSVTIFHDEFEKQ